MMRRASSLFYIPVLILPALLGGCSRRPGHPQPSAIQHAAPANAVLTVSSGDKQISLLGATLEPLVIQVNDAQGNGQPGVAVSFHGPARVTWNPVEGVTDASGQVSTIVTLGNPAGRYELRAAMLDASGKIREIKFMEIALGYQQTLGRELQQRYCARCHEQESTVERVSNYDNLTRKPHAFTDGDYLNKLSDADLGKIILSGGAALNQSPEMPAFGGTLNGERVKALLAYIRAVSDPPYNSGGPVYAKR